MTGSLRLSIIALVACAFAAPASATCMVSKAPLAKAQIILKPQIGKASLMRTTAVDGTLHLTRLKKGIWTAQFGATGKGVNVTVAKNGKLSLLAETQTVQCHAPPNPNAPPPAPPSVTHVIKQL